LVDGAAKSYTQTYPQVWITGSVPSGLVLRVAKTAGQVATSSSIRSATNGRFGFCTAREPRAPGLPGRCGPRRGRRPYH